MDRIRVSRDALYWFGLAVGALAVSGALAIVLVIQRIPAMVELLASDPELARRSLVVHVNLATGVWFFAFITALTCLVSRTRIHTARPAAVLAGIGVIAMAVPACFSDVHAVLSDYVPIVDHVLFLVGLAAVAAAILMVVIEVWLVATRIESAALPAEVQYGLRAAGICFLIAMLTIAGAYLDRDASASTLARFQHLFWGGGHVLQFAAIAGMLAGWLLLLHELLGTSLLAPRAAAWLFGALLLPTATGPWLAVSGHSPRAFTWMMELGIAPAVLVVMFVGARALYRHRVCGVMHWPIQPVALVGLLVSGAMTLVGFGLGAAISGNTTLTPAHYHVSIGAVTVTFMTVLLVMMSRFGAPVRWPRVAKWQPLLYGVGQSVFAGGLAIAGFWGQAARKTYGAGQQLEPPSHAGLVIAGIGGALALVGGVMFVVLVVSAWRHRDRH